MPQTLILFLYCPKYFNLNISSSAAFFIEMYYCIVLFCSLTQLIKYGISVSHIPCLSNERYLWMMFKTCWAVEEQYFSGRVELVGMHYT
jgi:hypothetical protein